MNGQVSRQTGQGAMALAGQRGAQVASSLQTVRRTMLDVFESIDSMKAATTAPYFLEPQFDVPEQPVSEEKRELWMQHLCRVREGQPSDGDLEALADKVRDAANAPFDKSKTRMVVGLMLAAFPNGRPHDPEAYMETIAHEIEVTGFGPASVAKGCNTVSRSSKFLPAAAEVLERIDDAANLLRTFLRQVDGYKAKLKYADALVEWMRDVPVLDRAQHNYTRPPEKPSGLRTRRGATYS